ncbi:MAG TPA: glycosyltransferase family 2 protein [Thermoanaerobaculia bacterium]|nr:glycosyltransferase family 2 protein [Thermoanaerobaculia bacterium]
MSAPRQVSVAVLTWNGRAHLETCLAALAEQADPGVDWEIVVLDNGSNDGTAEWLRRSRPPRVRLIESPVNLGFCAGNNRLVAAAAGDAVAFLNNDTRPRRDWLAALVAALAAAPGDVAAVSGQIVDWAGERLDFGRGVMTFDGHAFQLDFRRPLGSARVPAAGDELLFACGGNMLVRRASFLAAGGFDESYFAYLEDVDLGWRLWSGGERVLFTPGAVVHHRSSATSDLLGLYNRGFLFERNAFLTAYKNYEAGLWERVMPALLLTFLSRTQTLLADSNPGGGSLRIDPYAGWIANTAGPGSAPAPTGVPERAAPSPPWWSDLGGKWRAHGPREFFRRAVRKLLAGAARPVAGAAPGTAGLPPVPLLTDERTVAQLRALSYLLAHLDRAAAAREAVQRRRRRPDREIFARFPAFLVPTYPGDEALFASPGFAAWLPADLPLVRSTLAEVMELDNARGVTG